MQMKNVITKIVHDKRRPKNVDSYPEGHYLYNKVKPAKDEKIDKLDIYPVKIRLNYLRKQYYYPYPSKCDLTEDDFLNVFSPNPKGGYKKIHDILTFERKVADDIIDSLGEKYFSIAAFEKKFGVVSGDNKDLFFLLADLAKNLEKSERISTSVLTNCALVSLKKFTQKKKLPLDDVDPTFLNDYERWMLKEENSPTTVGMYLRRVRVIYMTAVKEGVIAPELYPFKDYEIPTGKNIKKAITHFDVGQISRYQPQSEGQEKAKDFWLLTFYCNGCNMKDLALLKNKDIDGKMIRFQRAKTLRSNKSKPVIISFALTDQIREIIKKWGSHSLNPDSYIFPILHKNATAKEKYKLVYNAIKTTNKHMKVICQNLKISSSSTTMVARHSFSTVARNRGNTVELISEALGHRSIKTTQNYLAGFQDKPKIELADDLIDFPIAQTA